MRILLAAVLAILATPTARAQTSVATLPAATASIAGVVYDSLRGGRLDDAIVQLVQGTTVRREAIARIQGQFRFDSVPPGTYLLRMLHATLDSIGLVVTSPEFMADAGTSRQIDLSIPPASRLVNVLCAPQEAIRGPSVLVGFVRDPATGAPVPGARVELDNSTSDVFGLTRVPSVRRTESDAQGRFRICGLPEETNGKLIVTRAGVSTGEVPVKINFGALLGIRAVNFALATQIVTVQGDSGRMIRVMRGDGSLSGQVVNERGEPVRDALVEVLNTGSSVKTRPDGRFSLDSLPSGSQTVRVRAIGFGITERAVEVGPNATAPPIIMDRFVPTLPAVTARADRREKKLDEIGFANRRLKNVGGTFKEGDELPQGVMMFSDLVRVIPGLKVEPADPSGMDRAMKFLPATGGQAVCLNIILDNQPYRQTDPGDLDRFIQPDMVEALEYYRPSTVPIEFFGKAGQTSCSVLVIWTRAVIPQRVPRGG